MSIVAVTDRDLLLTFRDGSVWTREVFMEGGSVRWVEGTPEEPHMADRPMTLSFDIGVEDSANSASSTLDGWLRIPPDSWEAMNLVSTLGAGRDMRLHLDVTIMGDKRGQIDRTLRFKHCKFNVGCLGVGGAHCTVRATCKATRPELV